MKEGMILGPFLNSICRGRDGNNRRGEKTGLYEGMYNKCGQEEGWIKSLLKACKADRASNRSSFLLPAIIVVASYL